MRVLRGVVIIQLTNKSNSGSFNRLRVSVSDRAAVVIFQVIDEGTRPLS